jgi:hypothetical protein
MHLWFNCIWKHWLFLQKRLFFLTINHFVFLRLLYTLVERKQKKMWKLNLVWVMFFFFLLFVSVAFLPKMKRDETVKLFGKLFFLYFVFEKCIVFHCVTHFFLTLLQRNLRNPIALNVFHSFRKIFRLYRFHCIFKKKNKNKNCWII